MGVGSVTHQDEGDDLCNPGEAHDKEHFNDSLQIRPLTLLSNLEAKV